MRESVEEEKEGGMRKKEEVRECCGFINHCLFPDTPAWVPPLLNDRSLRVLVCVCVLCVAAHMFAFPSVLCV